MNLNSENTAGAARVALLDQILFVMMVAVLCARPLISESFELSRMSFLPDSVGGTTPATVVWLDGILLLACVAACIRLRGCNLPALALVGYVLLLAAVVVSVSAADNKRLAANAGAHLFVMTVAAGALYRMLRARWMVHLLLAALLASGIANATKCISQRGEEFAATLEVWQEQKAALQAEGVDVESPMLVNYERRLQSGETFGYLYHPNVTAACLSMGLLIVAGALLGLLRKPDTKLDQRAAAGLVAAAVATLLGVGLWLTGSMGAIVSCVVAVGLLVLLGVGHRWISTRPKTVFAMLAGVYCGIIAIGGGYGVSKGTLPHTSLAFRWQYWQAAGQAFQQAPLTGIGRENFRAAYLLYKPASSTEEVNNPHDLWVTMLVELGPLGLLAGVILCGVAVSGALRRMSRQHRLYPTLAGRGVMIAVAAGVLLVQVCFSGQPLGAPGMFLLWCVYLAGVWVLAFLAAYYLMAQADEKRESGQWLSAGVLAAVCCTLIHNLIGFSLFTPAGLAFLAIAVAAACGLRRLGDEPHEDEAETEQQGGGRHWGFIVATGCVLLAIYAATIAWPTMRTQSQLRQAQALINTAGSYTQVHAVLADTARGLDKQRLLWDPSIPVWAAQTALHIAESDGLPNTEKEKWFGFAETMANHSIQCVPKAFSAHRLHARILQVWAEQSGDIQRLRRAEKEWAKAALPLYPTNTRARIDAAGVQYSLWKVTGLDEYRKKAIENYGVALEMDSLLEPKVAAKLRESELEPIRRHLEELQRE